MTSIFESRPPKTRPKLQPKQGSFGFQVYVYKNISYSHVRNMMIHFSNRTWTTGCICYDLFPLLSTFNNLALPTPSMKNWCLVSQSPVPKALCNSWQFRESGFVLMLPRHMWYSGPTSLLLPLCKCYRETWVPGRCLKDVTTASQHWVLQSCVAWKPKLPIGTSNNLNHLKWVFTVYTPED